MTRQQAIAPTVLALLLAAASSCRTSASVGRTAAAPQPTTPAPAAPAAARSEDAGASVAEAPAPTHDARPRCETAPGWRPEKIALPPAFAPGIPPGEELLWFAPGMFDPAADDYFTYVFELDFQQAPNAEPAEVQAMLREYYAGLMQTVAQSSERTAGEVGVELSASEGGLRGTVTMTDEFTGGGPLEVRIDLSFSGSCIVASVTPSASPDVAERLDAARRCLPCTTIH